MSASQRSATTAHKAAADRASRTLDKRQLRQLKRLAHALKPVVRLGNAGLTTGVRRELDIALSKHELVKIKLAADTRTARDEQLASLVHDAGAVVVQQIGNTATLFRRNRKQPVITLERS